MYATLPSRVDSSPCSYPRRSDSMYSTSRMYLWTVHTRISSVDRALISIQDGCVVSLIGRRLAEQRQSQSRRAEAFRRQSFEADGPVDLASPSLARPATVQYSPREALVLSIPYIPTYRTYIRVLLGSRLECRCRCRCRCQCQCRCRSNPASSLGAGEERAVREEASETKGPTLAR